MMTNPSTKLASSSGRNIPVSFFKYMPQKLLMFAGVFLSFNFALLMQFMVTGIGFETQGRIFETMLRLSLPLGILTCVLGMFSISKNGVAPRPFSSSDFVETVPFALSSHGLAACIWFITLWTVMLTPPAGELRLTAILLAFIISLFLNLRFDEFLKKHGSVVWEPESKFVFFTEAAQQRTGTTFIMLVIFGISLFFDFVGALQVWILGDEPIFTSLFKASNDSMNWDYLATTLTSGLLFGALFALAHLRLALLDAER